MTNTKVVNILGTDYTIRKMTLGIRKQFLQLQSKDVYEAQAFLIKECVVNPSFNSIDDVMNLDYEIADMLSLEISEFNKPSEDFLQRSKSLLSKASPLPEMKA